MGASTRRKLHWARLLAPLGLVGFGCMLVAPGCFNDGGDFASELPTTSNGPGAVSKGIGERCGDPAECRPGLDCGSDGTCVPGHSLEEGDPCLISAECQEALYCAAGICVPAGMGGQDDACVTDADCKNGFRCTLTGLSAVCLPEGSTDLGGECTSSNDCYGGLACIEDPQTMTTICAVVPPGTLPFGTPWQGIDCEADENKKDPVEAYFHIPRGDETDKDFFRLPFPNDVRLDNGKLNLSGFPTPGDGLTGFDLVQRYVDAIEDGHDGWGAYSEVYFRFSGALSTASFKDNVHVVDLGAKTKRSLYYSYQTDGGSYMCDYRMTVSRSRGQLWTPGASYAVYFTNITDKDDKNVSQPSDLADLLGSEIPAAPAVAAHYDKYAPLRQWLADESVPVASVTNATVFTVGQPRAATESIATVIDSMAPPMATDWTLCDTGVTSPCPDAEGERACPAADDGYHELHAMVSLPIFQEGSAPYLEPADGGNIKLAGTTAEVVRSEPVCLSLTVPKGAPPSGGWPTVVFAHGTGGHFRTHVTNQLAQDFAQGISDGQGNTVKAAILGIDQVQHATRRGGSTQSPNDLFFNFSNPKAARGNPIQGAADQISLSKLATSIAFDASGPTKELFNLHPTSIAFWGHSQGATQGAIAAPYAPWSGVLYTGQGASLKDALVSKTSPVDIAAVVPLVLQDFDKNGKLTHGNRHPVLNLMQHHIDGADPITYARMLSVAPSGEARHQFMVYGLNDTYTPSAVQTTYALAAGVQLAAHDASVTTAEEIGNLTETSLPASGNLTTNMKPVTAFTRQYGPAANEDGHFVGLSVASARGDAQRFLAGSLSGVVPQIGQ